MKVEETSPVLHFKPIHIVLETQEEVDAISTIVNSMQICKVFPALDDWHNQLEEYGDFEANWDEFVKILRK